MKHVNMEEYQEICGKYEKIWSTYEGICGKYTKKYVENMREKAVYDNSHVSSLGASLLDPRACVGSIFPSFKGYITGQSLKLRTFLNPRAYIGRKVSEFSKSERGIPSYFSLISSYSFIFFTCSVILFHIFFIFLRISRIFLHIFFIFPQKNFSLEHSKHSTGNWRVVGPSPTWAGNFFVVILLFLNFYRVHS